MKAGWARVPLALILLRFSIACVLLADGLDGHLSAWFVPLFVVAVFSDYLDGFMCRLIKLSSVELSTLDGHADAGLYLSVCCSVWLAYPHMVSQHLIPIAGLLGLQTISWLFSLVKFGKITSYHTYTAKLWGALLFLAIVEALTIKSGIVIPFMAVIGAACIIEDMVITAIMPYWKTGVLNVQAALRLREAHRLASVPEGARMQPGEGPCRAAGS